MFRTEFDESQMLLIAEISGYWSVETVSGFRSQITDHIRQVRLQHPFFHILVLGRALSVQARDVADALVGVANDLTALCPGRVAVVAGSVLNKLQASRTSSHECFRVFLDDQHAKVWLLAATQR